MQAPRIANRKGYYVEVKAGRRYFWCACGRSANQPFCDGSHAGTEFTPVLFEAKADEEVIFCGCKHTGARPFCDGTHNNLPGGYTEDDPDSAANRAIPAVAHGERPDVRLDGACFVFSTKRAKLVHKNGFAHCRIVGPREGAQFQSQFHAEVARGRSPVIAADGRHTILFVTAGQGDIEISGRRFVFAPCSGFYVGTDEAFRIHNSADEPVKLFITQNPPAHDLAFVDNMLNNFDERYPNRFADVDARQRHEMGERFFQILINREHGSTEMTQFIGNIPRSKAEPHRHLYEETLIFLNGTGMVWTEHAKTPVGPGDVLFLPRKLVHSLQCTCDEGLDVVGVICPGDNPSINY